MKGLFNSTFFSCIFIANCATCDLDKEFLLEELNTCVDSVFEVHTEGRAIEDSLGEILVRLGRMIYHIETEREN